MANGFRNITQGIRIVPGTVSGSVLGDIRVDSASTSLKYHNGTSEVDIVLPGSSTTFAAGSESAPSIASSGDTDTGIYFPSALNQVALTAGGDTIFRVRSDGQIDCGQGADDDDHNTATSSSDFNYRGQTIRCVSNTATGVTIAALNRSTTGAGADSVLKAEVDTDGGDPYIFLSVEGTGMSIGLDNSDNDSLIIADGTGLPNTVRAKLDGSTKSWQFGTDTNTSMAHKFIGASARIENSTSTGPSLQIRSLETAGSSTSALGALEWYSSDTTAVGIQADIRALSNSNTGADYDLSFRTGTSAVLAQALRLTSAGRTQVNNGSTALPGLAGISDTDTGIQFGGSNDMYLVGGASVKLQILPASIRYDVPVWSSMSGSFGAPEIAHESDTDTGLVWGQANDVYITCGGVGTVTASTTGVTIGSSVATTHRFNISTATTATSGAATLPGNPVGFITININGTTRTIPYYAT